MSSRAASEDLIYEGRDPSEVAAYGIAEAAHWLDLSASTIRAWTIGQHYKDRGKDKLFRPVIAIADRDERLLSFRNLVELHVLAAIRREYDVSLQNVRRAVSFMKKHLGTDHPLASERMLTDGKDLLVTHGEHLLNVSRSGQVEMKIVEAYLQRIEFGSRGEPVRLFPFTTPSLESDRRSVVIDPRVQFGRPCLRETGVTTSVVVERFRAGESIDQIATDYGLDRRDVEEAIRYERLPRAA